MYLCFLVKLHNEPKVLACSGLVLVMNLVGLVLHGWKYFYVVMISWWGAG